MKSRYLWILGLLAAGAADALGQNNGQSGREIWRRGAAVQPAVVGQIDAHTYQLRKADIVRTDNPNLVVQPQVGLIQDWPKPIDKRDFRVIDRTALFDPGHIYVAFKPGAKNADVLTANRSIGATVAWASELVPMTYRVAVPPGQDIEEVVNRYLDMPNVLYAEPCYLSESDERPNDTYWQAIQNECHCPFTLAENLCAWGMEETDDFPGSCKATVAWDEWVGNPNFVIAVIDSGTAITHPDLAANIWQNPTPTVGAPYFGTDLNGWNVALNTSDVTPCGVDAAAAHGTHTAGTVGAVGDNAEGVAGMNWQCKLMILRCSKDFTFDGEFIPCGRIIFFAEQAMSYAMARGAKVSNNSYGGGAFNQTAYNTILAGQALGHLVVASAGNDGRDTDVTPNYPASYDLSNIVAVGAIGPGGVRPAFSNYGLTTVDLAAPGRWIVSTNVAGYFSLNGTSMSTPHVAGGAALVWSRNPELRWWQVKERVVEGAPLQLFETECASAPCSNDCCEGGIGAYCDPRSAVPYHVPCRSGTWFDAWRAMGYWFGNTAVDPLRPPGSFQNPHLPSSFASELQTPRFNRFATINLKPGTTLSATRLDQPLSIRAPDGGPARLEP